MKKYSNPILFSEIGGTPIEVEDDFYVGLTRSQWHGGTDLFDAYDINKNGVIDKEEFDQWMEDIGED